MRLLGIDYGSKRIGTAISDERAVFSFPHSVFKNTGIDDVVSEVKRVCGEHNVIRIILGESLNLKGEKNPIAKEAEKFKTAFESVCNIPIEYENEILTTQAAKRYPDKVDDRTRKKKVVKEIDASAAALILQSYLDRQQTAKNG